MISDVAAFQRKMIKQVLCRILISRGFDSVETVQDTPQCISTKPKAASDDEMRPQELE